MAVYVHCVYVPQLSYPLICWWTSRLLPRLGYYKQCCNQHWGTRVSFNSGFLGVYAQQWDCWVKWYMEFRKMVMITLYIRQQKRHRCIEQSFGLCGRGRGWDDLGEWHWNTYNIICETNRQTRFDAWYRMLRAGALGWPRGMVLGGRWEGGFRMGNTCAPLADSCWCMAKPIQYCKIISL